MRKVMLKDLKKGDFFTLKDYGEFPEESRVYVRDEYDRSEKKYGYSRFSDWNHYGLKKGTTIVYTDFTF